MLDYPDAERIGRDHARLLFGDPPSREPGPPAPPAAALDFDAGPRETAPADRPLEGDRQTLLAYLEDSMHELTGMRRPFLRP